MAVAADKAEGIHEPAEVGRRGGTEVEETFVAAVARSEQHRRFEVAAEGIESQPGLSCPKRSLLDRTPDLDVWTAIV